MAKQPLTDQAILDRINIIGHNDCWEWQGPFFADGYGRVWRDGKSQKVHRVIFDIMNIKIPPGMCVCHRCDNKKCANTAHLFFGTMADNMRDRDTKGRAARGDRQGLRLHPEKRCTEDHHWTNTKPESVLRGECHGMSKLSATQVLDIKRKWTTKQYTQQQLANLHGIKQITVSNILTGKSWRHVTLEGPG